jgi:hypothetical protein
MLGISFPFLLLLVFTTAIHVQAETLFGSDNNPAPTL